MFPPRRDRTRYLTYAISVITSRALPDVRDGLKPVQRRILYTMYHDLHLTFDGRPRKCAKIIGDVTGNYHPHGTVRPTRHWSVWPSLGDARAAGPWPGQFRLGGRRPAGGGSLHRGQTGGRRRPAADGVAAAHRADAAQLRQHRGEPVVLPAQFPNLLVNGASGIAVGLATNIPPHNLGEVCGRRVLLIDNPEATTAQLHGEAERPRLPARRPVVTDRATLRKIYEEGTGGIKVQGEWKLEEVGKKQQIVVTSIPYGVDKGKLEYDIGVIIDDANCRSCSS